MSRKTLCLLILCFAFSACEDGDNEFSNLNEYLENNLDWNRSSEIIACAAGGGEFSTLNPDAPISIFFYPQTTAFDFKYFETSSASIDENNLKNYEEVELEVSDVFNGYLRKFEREASDKDRWAIVSYRLDNTLWTCKPIALKAGSAPTVINPEAVSVDETSSLNPAFSWIDDSDTNDIYFQVVSDEDGNLISGTYTFDKDFSFYQPEEFAPNITNPQSTPTLESGKTYNFTLMGVGEDNWVNLISERNFTLD